MTAFLTAIGVVFLAELGDKTQLMAMAFATKYKASRVLLGVAIGALTVNLISVLVGRAVGATLAEHKGVIGIIAGAAFLAFAVWTLIETLRGEDDEDEDAPETRPSRFGGSAVLIVATAFFVAELGDRTMLAAAALAMQNGLIATWLGSTIGLVLASALGVVFGAALGKRLSGRTMGFVSVALFTIFGLLLVVYGIREL